MHSMPALHFIRWATVQRLPSQPLRAIATAIRFSIVSDWLYAWEMHRQDRLAALHTGHVICCEKHCIVVAVSVAGRFRCRGSLHQRCTKRCICDIPRQLILVAWFCYSDRRTSSVHVRPGGIQEFIQRSWLCFQSSKSRSRDHSVSPTLRNSAPAANCPAASQACIVAWS